MAYVLLSRLAADPAEEWPATSLPRLGFQKLHAVGPGLAAEATLVLRARDFSRWDTTLRTFTIRPGKFKLAVRDCGDGGVVTIV